MYPNSPHLRCCDHQQDDPVTCSGITLNLCQPTLHAHQFISEKSWTGFHQDWKLHLTWWIDSSVSEFRSSHNWKAKNRSSLEKLEQKLILNLPESVYFCLSPGSAQSILGQALTAAAPGFRQINGGHAFATWATLRNPSFPLTRSKHFLAYISHAAKKLSKQIF